jgi:hypothetical protein
MNRMNMDSYILYILFILSILPLGAFLAPLYTGVGVLSANCPFQYG